MRLTSLLFQSTSRALKRDIDPRLFPLVLYKQILRFWICSTVEYAANKSKFSPTNVYAMRKFRILEILGVIVSSEQAVVARRVVDVLLSKYANFQAALRSSAANANGRWWIREGWIQKAPRSVQRTLDAVLARMDGRGDTVLLFYRFTLSN